MGRSSDGGAQMSVRYCCDGCGRDVSTGTRITVTAVGFQWGNGDEHFCSAACLVGRYHATGGAENLLRQYKHNLERAK